MHIPLFNLYSVSDNNLQFFIHGVAFSRTKMLLSNRASVKVKVVLFLFLVSNLGCPTCCSEEKC